MKERIMTAECSGGENRYQKRQRRNNDVIVEQVAGFKQHEEPPNTAIQGVSADHVAHSPTETCDFLPIGQRCTGSPTASCYSESILKKELKVALNLETEHESSYCLQSKVDIVSTIKAIKQDSSDICEDDCKCVNENLETEVMNSCDALEGMECEVTFAVSEAVDTNETISTSIKTQFVRALCEACYVNPTDIAKIRCELDGIMTDCCRDLQAKHPLFKDCTPILRGSMHDETKTVTPDEIDFMIYLPAAPEYMTLDVNKIPGVVTLKNDCNMTATRASRMIKKSLLASLPQKWSMPDVNKVYRLHKTLTRSFLLRRPELNPAQDISLDVVLGTKVADNFMVISRNWKMCLLNKSQEEGEIIQKLREQSHIVPSLIAAKYLAQQFFGHQEMRRKGFNVRKSRLPSYPLKTILFHMLKDEGQEATDQHFSLESSRANIEQEQFKTLHKLFKKLAEALEKDRLRNFFLPQYDVFRLSQNFDRDKVLSKCHELLKYFDRMERGDASAVTELCDVLRMYSHCHYTKHSDTPVSLGT